jgi:Fe-Mn family superoxide dismutase
MTVQAEQFVANPQPLALPPLPYPDNALEPVISAKTLQVHHNLHHKAYVDAVNKLLPGTPFVGMPLVQIVQGTAGKPQYLHLFENAAQAWNHDFYWHSLTPRGGGAPPAAFKSQVITAFGSVEALKEALAKAAKELFGSGWVWLVADGQKLGVVSTSNADNPLAGGHKPLLAIDVWEHAYYLDVQNRRAEYVQGILENLINWNFAAANANAAGNVVTAREI